jgi:hypothetical protein
VRGWLSATGLANYGLPYLGEITQSLELVPGFFKDKGAYNQRDFLVEWIITIQG